MKNRDEGKARIYVLQTSGQIVYVGWTFSSLEEVRKDGRSLYFKYTNKGQHVELTEIDSCSFSEVNKKIRFHVEQLKSQGIKPNFRIDCYKRKTSFIKLPTISYKLISALRQYGDVKKIAKANGLIRETLRLQFKNNSFRPEYLRPVLKHYNLTESEVGVSID